MNTAVRGMERARDWLDERGRAAWIAVTVIGFVLFWPIGLALLIYMFWSKRMGCNLGSQPPPLPPPRHGPHRQHRLRHLPRGDAEAARGGARRLRAVPRPAPGGEGPGGVRPVHDGPLRRRRRPEPTHRAGPSRGPAAAPAISDGCLRDAELGEGLARRLAPDIAVSVPDPQPGPRRPGVFPDAVHDVAVVHEGEGPVAVDKPHPFELLGQAIVRAGENRARRAVGDGTPPATRRATPPCAGTA